MYVGFGFIMLVFINKCGAQQQPNWLGKQWLSMAVRLVDHLQTVEHCNVKLKAVFQKGSESPRTLPWGHRVQVVDLGNEQTLH